MSTAIMSSYLSLVVLMTCYSGVVAAHSSAHRPADILSRIQTAALQVDVPESVIFVRQNVINVTQGNLTNQGVRGTRGNASSGVDAGTVVDQTTSSSVSLAPSARSLAINIVTEKLTLVHSGTCLKGCRVSDAVVSQTFMAFSGAGASFNGHSMLVGVEAISMDKNLVPSASVLALAPLLTIPNTTLPVQSAASLFLPLSPLSSAAQFRLNTTCRGTGTAIIHLRFTSSPEPSGIASIPVHVFLKVVCNVPTPSCEGFDCGIHGICAGGGTCECEDGYSGLQCQIGPMFSGGSNETSGSSPPCASLSYCSGNGECIDDEVCSCNVGWGGRMCQVSTQDDALCATFSFCRAHGKCVSTGEGRYECYCDDGFEGDDCGTVIADSCPLACSGHGICIDGRCECHLGYHGDDCSKAFSPCGGCLMGECVESLDGSIPTCICDAEWAGPHCTKYDVAADVCAATSFCSGQGFCALSQESQPHCVCAQGFQGVICEAVAESKCELGCSSYGTCEPMNDKCNCEQGRAGSACEKTICPVPANSLGVSCSANGVCRGAPLACLCMDPYFGPACQNANCNASVLCSSNGVCTKSSGLAVDLCQCEEGWTGARCSQANPSTSIASEGDRREEAGDTTKAASLNLYDQSKSTHPSAFLKHVESKDIYEDSELDVY